MSVTVENHLAYCRQVAKDRLQMQTKPHVVVSSLVNDLQSHPKTRAHPIVGLIAMARLAGGLKTADEIRALLDKELA